MLGGVASRDEIRGGSWGRRWRFEVAASWVVSFALVWFASVAGHAQTRLAVDRFQPSAPADLFSSIEDPTVPEPQLFGAAQLLTSYAHHPLEVRDVDTGDYTPVIDDRLWFVGQGQFSALGLLQFDVMLPFVALNEGRAVTGDQGLYAEPSGTALGDLRLGGRVQALAQDGVWPSVGLSARAWMPTGEASAYTSTERVRYAASITIGGDYEDFSYRASGGRRRQYLYEESTFKIASDTVVGAAVGYRVGDLVVGPELLLSLASNEVKHRGSTVGNLEGLLTGHYGLGQFALRAGVGGALAQRQGTADFRALLAVVWTSEALQRLPEPPPPPPPPPPPDRATARTVVPELRGEALERQIAHAQEQAVPVPPVARVDEKPDELPRCDPAQPEVQPCAADTDGDGFIDTEDACPNESGVENKNASRRGCPRKALVTSTHIEFSGRIQFQTGSATLTADSEPILAAIAELMGEYPDIARIAVEGHTDDVGREADNLALSRERALAVARWLVARGVDERRLEVHGYGPRRPKASNDDEAGRMQNRRVEFTIIRRDAAGEDAWTDGPVQATTEAATTTNQSVAPAPRPKPGPSPAPAESTPAETAPAETAPGENGP